MSRWTGRRWLWRRDRAVRGRPDLSRWTGRRWLWRRGRAVRRRPDLSRWTGGRWLWRRGRAVRGRSNLSRWTGRRWLRRCGHHRSLRLHPRLPPAAVREDEHREKNDDANLSAIQRETVAGLPLVFGSVSQSGPRELPGSVSLNGCRVHLLTTSRTSPLHRVRFFQFGLLCKFTHYHCNGFLGILANSLGRCRAVSGNLFLCAGEGSLYAVAVTGEGRYPARARGRVRDPGGICRRRTRARGRNCLKGAEVDPPP